MKIPNVVILAVRQYLNQKQDELESYIGPYGIPNAEESSAMKKEIAELEQFLEANDS